MRNTFSDFQSHFKTLFVPSAFEVMSCLCRKKLLRGCRNTQSKLQHLWHWKEMPDGSDITVQNYDLLMQKSSTFIAVLIGLRSWDCPDAKLDVLIPGPGSETFHCVFLS